MITILGLFKPLAGTMFIVTLAAVLGTVGTSSAHASLKACNETNVRASVAIGYREADEWVSEGWWVVPPGECKTVIGDDLVLKRYYWRATGKGQNWSTSRFMFCASREVFTIIGDKNCQDRGYTSEAFNEIVLDEGQRGYTLSLLPTQPKADGKQALPDDATEQAGTSTIPGSQMAQTSTAQQFPAGNMDARGTHGEPFSVTGILSNCQLDGESYSCDLLANGFRYVAGPTNPTPFALLEALEGFAYENPVSTMSWTGDIVFYEGNMAQVVLRDVSPAAPGPYANVYQALQGLWDSNEDSQSQLLIAGGEMTFFHANIPQISAFMEITNQKHASCEGPGDEGTYIISRDYGDDANEEPYCYSIVELTDTNMSLFPLGTMRDLEFSRNN
ncbi:MAG: DUF1036 domain-containing protein [Pseudomonadota bacterium]